MADADPGEVTVEAHRDRLRERRDQLVDCRDARNARRNALGALVQNLSGSYASTPGPPTAGTRHRSWAGGEPAICLGAREQGSLLRKSLIAWPLFSTVS